MFNKSSFIERSIMGALSFFKGSIFAEEYASYKGLLQVLDVRIKLLIIFIFLAGVLFSRNIYAVISLYLLCLLLSLLSRINILFFLKRTLIFIPLFSLFVALPAIFSVVTPGKELFGFGPTAFHMGITQQGLLSAGIFLSRVAASVSFIILLALTTRNTELLRALRIFKVPQIFVMITGMCYRYIYLFVEVVENTYSAIKSRVGILVPHKKGRDIAAWNIGSLWQRSYYLNQAVYNAMLSRGYCAEPKALDEFKTGVLDWACLSFAVIIICCILYWGH